MLECHLFVLGKFLLKFPLILHFHLVQVIVGKKSFLFVAVISEYFRVFLIIFSFCLVKVIN